MKKSLDGRDGHWPVIVDDNGRQADFVIMPNQ